MAGNAKTMELPFWTRVLTISLNPLKGQCRLIWSSARKKHPRSGPMGGVRRAHRFLGCQEYWSRGVLDPPAHCSIPPPSPNALCVGQELCNLGHALSHRIRIHIATEN